MKKVTMRPQPLIYPMPALLIGTNVDNKANFMTAAWCGIASGEPPMISVAIRHQRYTHRGIRQNMTFSVNVPSADQVKDTDYCGIISGKDFDKAKICHFEVFYGKVENAPLIGQCPVNLGCRVAHILDLGSHSLFVGRIEDTEVSEDCLTDGKPDVSKIKPFIFTTFPSRDYYVFGQVIGKAFESGKEFGEKFDK
jgi:flavin reductase (DIM6/NTAB) family NADH-FMN oxidoreductase RutF